MCSKKTNTIKKKNRDHSAGCWYMCVCVCIVQRVRNIIILAGAVLDKKLRAGTIIIIIMYTRRTTINIHVPKGGGGIPDPGAEPRWIYNYCRTTTTTTTTTILYKICRWNLIELNPSAPNRFIIYCIRIFGTIPFEWRAYKLCVCQTQKPKEKKTFCHNI